MPIEGKHIVVSEEIHERVTAAAKERGRTISSLAEDLLEDALDHIAPPVPPPPPPPVTVRP
jgi:predicted HicB family RNase H-like nuclease